MGREARVTVRLSGALKGKKNQVDASTAFSAKEGVIIAESFRFSCGVFLFRFRFSCFLLRFFLFLP